MHIIPVPVTVIDGGERRRRFRATLHDGGVTVWRCTCDRLHLSKGGARSCGLDALRARLGRQGMRVWSARFQKQITVEDIGRMDEERSLVLLEIQTNPHLPAWQNPESFPSSADAARTAIVNYERIMLEDESWDEVRKSKKLLELIIEAFKEHTEIRRQAEISLLCGEWRIAREFIAAQKAGFVGTPGRPWNNLVGKTKLSIRKLFGKDGHNYVKRLRLIEPLTPSLIRERGHELHKAAKDATLNALYELIYFEQTAARRKASLRAEPFPEGMDYRIGDCRVALDDIEDNSVAAIITDPPYGVEAEPLYRWLAAFAARVLVDGGSLICYTGTGMLPRDFAIFERQAGLKYWWTAAMLFQRAQKLFYAGVRPGYRPILWYIKGSQRRIVHERKTFVLDVLNDRRPAATEAEELEQTDNGLTLAPQDKSEHGWSQGDAGVRSWIHHLTQREIQDERGEVIYPADIIIDPFAGTGKWGRIAAGIGRRWIGCDVADGGMEEVVADELMETEEDVVNA